MITVLIVGLIQLRLKLLTQTVITYICSLFLYHLDKVGAIVSNTVNQLFSNMKDMTMQRQANVKCKW